MRVCVCVSILSYAGGKPVRTAEGEKGLYVTVRSRLSRLSPGTLAFSPTSTTSDHPSSPVSAFLRLFSFSALTHSQYCILREKKNKKLVFSRELCSGHLLLRLREEKLYIYIFFFLNIHAYIFLKYIKWLSGTWAITPDCLVEWCQGISLTSTFDLHGVKTGF